MYRIITGTVEEIENILSDYEQRFHYKITDIKLVPKTAIKTEMEIYVDTYCAVVFYYD